MSSSSVTHSIAVYGPHERQVIGIWRRNSASASRKWLVFIHGGAWRDPRNTYKDGEFLLTELLKDGAVSRSFGGMASIDYRLSPDVKHPSHIDDALSALNHLIDSYSADQFVLVGHSAGAFIACQVLTRWNHPTATIPLVIGVEGIYNIPYMLEENSYDSFVREAFGDNEDDWQTVSPIGPSFEWSNVSSIPSDARNNGSGQRPAAGGKKPTLVVYPGTVVIVHSPEDELLGIEYQPKFAKSFLAKSSIRVFEESAHGKHDDVYVSHELVNIVKKYVKNIE